MQKKIESLMNLGEDHKNIAMISGFLFSNLARDFRFSQGFSVCVFFVKTLSDIFVNERESLTRSTPIRAPCSNLKTRKRKTNTKV